MRIAVLLMLLAVGSNSAAAEWVAVGENDTYRAYVDTAAIRKSGQLVEMWSIADYKSVQKGDLGQLSTKLQSEYDCNEPRWRSLYFSWHPGNMAQGKAIFETSDPDKWVPVRDGALNQILWKFACGKR